MGEDTPDGTGPSSDVSDQISEHRAVLLAVLARAADEGDKGVPTGRLRETAGIPPGSMAYHMDGLVDRGLVDVIGRENEGGGGSPSKVYSITARGRDVLDQPGQRRFASGEEVAELRVRVNALEAEVDRRQQEIVELVRLLQRELNVDVGTSVSATSGEQQ